MKVLAWLALAGVVAASAQTARARDMSAGSAAAVRAADQAFEKRAQEVGIAQAFREFMDETDGLQFNGGPPVHGAAAIYKAMGGNAAPTSVLEWTLVDAWGSKGGDMGVTTGTWVVSRNKEHTGPQMKGRYVTVWRKDAHGAWKGLIDIGTPDP